MSKRERKLLDYTRCKRNMDALKKGDKISPEKLGLAQVRLILRGRGCSRLGLRGRGDKGP